MKFYEKWAKPKWDEEFVYIGDTFFLSDSVQGGNCCMCGDKTRFIVLWAGLYICSEECADKFDDKVGKDLERYNEK